MKLRILKAMFQGRLCSTAAPMTYLAMQLLVSLSSLASLIPLARCGHLMFPSYCLTAATLIKLLFQCQKLSTDGADFSVCSCSFGVRPVLVCYITFCIAVTES